MKEFSLVLKRFVVMMSIACVLALFREAVIGLGKNAPDIFNTVMFLAFGTYICIKITNWIIPEKD